MTIGRPRKEINWDIFEELCQIHCTQQEIASVFHVERHTLSEKVQEHYGECYSTIYQRYMEGGKASLRRHQFNLSKNNANMAIYLGKQYLGQRDPDYQDKSESLADDIHAAIAETIRERRVQIDQRPIVENQQSLLDQER